MIGKSRKACATNTCSIIKTVFPGGILPLLVCLSVSSVALGVESPTSVIKDIVDEVIRLVSDEELKKPDQADRRQELLEEAISQRFDFEEMAKRSLAAHWRQRNESEQRRFVELFQNLLSNTYSGRIEDYSGEKVQYHRERLRDSFAEVQTTIVSSKTQIALDYRLILKDENWRVYDVVVDGVSLVRNYRSQFDRIIRSSSYEELVKTLQERSGDIADPLKQ